METVANIDLSKGTIYRIYNRIVGPTKDKTRYFVYTNLNDAKENYIIAKCNIPKLEQRFPNYKFYVGIECYINGELDLKETWNVFSSCYDIINSSLTQK